jgi:hypothetical protein
MAAGRIFLLLDLDIAGSKLLLHLDLWEEMFLILRG